MNTILANNAASRTPPATSPLPKPVTCPADDLPWRCVLGPRLVHHYSDLNLSGWELPQDANFHGVPVVISHADLDECHLSVDGRPLYIIDSTITNSVIQARTASIYVYNTQMRATAVHDLYDSKKLTFESSHFVDGILSLSAATTLKAVDSSFKGILIDKSSLEYHQPHILTRTRFDSCLFCDRSNTLASITAGARNAFLPYRLWRSGKTFKDFYPEADALCLAEASGHLATVRKFAARIWKRTGLKCDNSPSIGLTRGLKRQAYIQRWVSQDPEITIVGPTEEKFPLAGLFRETHWPDLETTCWSLAKTRRGEGFFFPGTNPRQTIHFEGISAPAIAFGLAFLQAIFDDAFIFEPEMSPQLHEAQESTRATLYYGGSYAEAEKLTHLYLSMNANVGAIRHDWRVVGLGDYFETFCFPLPDELLSQVKQ